MQFSKGLDLVISLSFHISVSCLSWCILTKKKLDQFYCYTFVFLYFVPFDLYDCYHVSEPG